MSIVPILAGEFKIYPTPTPAVATGSTTPGSPVDCHTSYGKAQPTDPAETFDKFRYAREKRAQPNLTWCRAQGIRIRVWVLFVEPDDALVLLLQI